MTYFIHILNNNKVKKADICRNVSKFAPKFVIERSMRRVFNMVLGLMAVLCLMTSCLSSDNDTTTYDDMAIITFKLGTLNRYLHTTTTSGADSVYKSTYSASTYKMNIDQINHKISNADSLLLGTDLAHVICTVTTKNGGSVFIKSMTSDSLSYFSSGSDSVNFSVPRVFRVYATDGSGYRDYTVSLTARQQTAGVFKWVAANKADFPAADDENERKAAEAAGLKYIGKTYVEAYAFSSSGALMETEDNGVTWKEDRLDSPASLLPTSSIAYATWILDALTDYALIVGRRTPTDKTMTLWRKLADYDKDGQWVYMPLASDNPYYLPAMDYVALAYYDNKVLAFGSDKKIYISRDQGITWKTSSSYAYPSDFTATTGYQVAAERNLTWLWLYDPATGKAWKGAVTE